MQLRKCGDLLPLGSKMIYSLRSSAAKGHNHATISLHLLSVSQFIRLEAPMSFSICHRAVRPAVRLSGLCEQVLTNAQADGNLKSANCSFRAASGIETVDFVLLVRLCGCKCLPGLWGGSAYTSQNTISQMTCSQKLMLRFVWCFVGMKLVYSDS